MSNVPVTLATRNYAYVQPLANGDVRVEGVDLNLERSWDALPRVAANSPDVPGGEASFARYLVAPLMILWILYLVIKGLVLIPGGGTGASIATQALSLVFLGTLVWFASLMYRQHRVELRDSRVQTIHG